MADVRFAGHGVFERNRASGNSIKVYSTWARVLAGEADLRPGSITARRAASVSAETGRIEDAATCLGFASLIRAAAAIGYDRRTRTPNAAPPSGPHAARGFPGTSAH